VPEATRGFVSPITEKHELYEHLMRVVASRSTRAARAAPAAAPPRCTRNYFKHHAGLQLKKKKEIKREKKEKERKHS
jgi:hypothetical protein